MLPLCHRVEFRIEPHDCHLLTLKWGSHNYADTFCPFEHKSGSVLCSHLSKFFRYIMFRCNYIMYTYVDNILGTGVGPQAHNAFQYLLGMLQDLGFPISQSTLVSPTTRCNCLGIIVDTKECTLSIPYHKLKEILSQCECTLHSNVITVCHRVSHVHI